MASKIRYQDFEKDYSNEVRPGSRERFSAPKHTVSKQTSKEFKLSNSYGKECIKKESERDSKKETNCITDWSLCNGSDDEADDLIFGNPKVDGKTQVTQAPAINHHWTIAKNLERSKNSGNSCYFKGGEAPKKTLLPNHPCTISKIQEPHKSINTGGRWQNPTVPIHQWTISNNSPVSTKNNNNNGFLNISNTNLTSSAAPFFPKTLPKVDNQNQELFDQKTFVYKDYDYRKFESFNDRTKNARSNLSKPLFADEQWSRLSQSQTTIPDRPTNSSQQCASNYSSDQSGESAMNWRRGGHEKAASYNGSTLQKLSSNQSISKQGPIKQISKTHSQRGFYNFGNKAVSKFDKVMSSDSGVFDRFKEPKTIYLSKYRPQDNSMSHERIMTGDCIMDRDCTMTQHSFMDIDRSDTQDTMMDRDPFIPSR